MGVGYHSTFLMEDGTVKVVGRNDQGQLGLGHITTPVLDITTIPGLSGVKQIASGSSHTVFLMNDGTVKVVGLNTSGQLGLGNITSPVLDITTIPGLSGVKQVACGNSHTVFLMNDGTVKSVGGNSSGQLGLGNTTTPILDITTIPSLSGVQQIACGSSHTITIMNDGTVKSAGANGSGELGLGHSTTPVTSLTAISGLSGVKQVAIGSGHSAFLMDDGTVKVTGGNTTGQLGLGHTNAVTSPTTIPSLSGVKQITCTYTGIVFTMQNGTIKAVGGNNYGQLGLGNITDPITTVTDLSLTVVKKVVCGRYHTVFIMEDGAVKSVGHNQYGQLGSGVATASPYYVTALQTPSVTGVKSLWDEFISVIRKFLLSDGGVLKKMGTLDLVIVGDAPATEEMFQQGNDDISGLVTTAAKDTLTMTSRGALGAGAVYAVSVPRVYTTITKLAEKA